MKGDNLKLGDDDSIGNEDEASPEASVASILSGVSQLHQRLEEVCSLLCARGSDGTYSQTWESLSKVVHDSTRETQARRRAAGERDNVQATLFDMWYETHDVDIEIVLHSM